MRASILIKFEILQSELNVASKSIINSKHIYIHIYSNDIYNKKKVDETFPVEYIIY